MPTNPIVFRTTQRIKFSDLDPYNHMTTGKYAIYYIDHRMEGLREHIGWDLKRLVDLPFMMWVRRLEIDFIKPARGDQEITMTSFVREFQGADALIECAMVDATGKELSRCHMTVACVDRTSQRATEWPADVAALFFQT
jgi:acyl-CoA thioester hydrolase